MDLSRLLIKHTASPRNKKYVHCGPQAPRTATGQDKEDNEAGWGCESKWFSAEVASSLFSSKPPQMISAEAPVLFAKAAEMFIHELTMRAWIHTEVRYLLTTSENSSTWLDQLIWLKMPGQQEKDSSEERHCHGHHQIRPIWLPHWHCAQVLYINIIHTHLDNRDLLTPTFDIQRWHQADHQKRGIKCEDGPWSGQFDNLFW